MPIFQVSLRTMQSSGTPKRRNKRLRQRWSTVVRGVTGMMLGGALLSLALVEGASRYIFILLPVMLSLLVKRSQFTNLLHGTRTYGVLTIFLALLYFGGITELEVIIHPGVARDTVLIIATTALTWAALFSPLYSYGQEFIERRFNLHNQKTVKAIEAFNATLREEIDLEQLRERLLAIIQQTMQPQHISLWVSGTGLDMTEKASMPLPPSTSVTTHLEAAVVDDDPLISYLLSHVDALEVDRLELDSPMLRDLKAERVEIALPLASQGELIGLLALGSRLDGQEYLHEDRTLLNTLTTQVAPALRVAQMVQERQKQILERERIEQELRTAKDIQLTFLPKGEPSMPGWQLLSYYQPAREVGGDFYDFLPFGDGRLGLVIGDVSGKGIPAALVMMATRTMLRTATQEKATPGEVLARVNNLLHEDIPTGMFATCFYAILDCHSGRLRYANAGHEPPYRQRDGKVSELWATGMPLGMLPGTCYDEYEVILSPGDVLLFYSDGLVEAHNAERDMFGFPRLMELLNTYPDGANLIPFLLHELASFVQGEEQEDDVTLVTLYRASASQALAEEKLAEEPFKLLSECTIASKPGNERLAIEQVASAVQPLQLPVQRLDSLKTAVAESVMNAIEHGNHSQPEKLVILQVLASESSILIRIRDQGEDDQQVLPRQAKPDLAAKLAEQETARGWGLFLIENLVDELHMSTDRGALITELIMHRHVESQAIQ